MLANISLKLSIRFFDYKSTEGTESGERQRYKQIPNIFIQISYMWKGSVKFTYFQYILK